MFDRSLLFVGAGGVGLGTLAEALALDCLRSHGGPMPLRVYSATTNDAAQSDPVMQRAMARLKLDTRGLSLKPLALYAFAGAPRIDHVVLLGANLPPATRLGLGEGVDVRHWDVNLTVGNNKAAPAGARYLDILRAAEALRQPICALVSELTSMDAVSGQAYAHSA